VEHEVEFRASRVRAVRLVLGSLGFVGAGIWLASSSSWIGWAAIAFGGVGMVVAIVQLITVDRTILELDSDGFAMIQWGVGQHRSKDFLSWSDVESFWITRLIWNKVIAVKYSPSFRKAREARAVMRRLTRARGVGGFNGIIPDQYSEPLETICAALNEWKRRYG
jgi:hypothetical protein